MTTHTLKNVCGFVYVIIAIVNAAPPTKLPKDFVQCKRSDPKLNECVLKGLTSAIPHLAKGVPSLGLIKVDPLRITNLEINQGTGPVSINLKFKDLDIINIKSIALSNLQIDLEKYNLKFEVIPKPLMLTGFYEVSGKVLVLPIVGKGKSKINLDVEKIYVDVQWKPVVRNGITYLEVEKLTWKFIPTNMRIKLDNLFDGNKALGNNMNAFLNENWRELFNELQPAIEQVFGLVFTEIAEQFLKRVPLNQIFLE